MYIPSAHSYVSSTASPIFCRFFGGGGYVCILSSPMISLLIQRGLPCLDHFRSVYWSAGSDANVLECVWPYLLACEQEVNKGIRASVSDCVGARHVVSSLLGFDVD